jgi:hypothetical protein
MTQPRFVRALFHFPASFLGLSRTLSQPTLVPLLAAFSRTRACWKRLNEYVPRLTVRYSDSTDGD